MEQLPVFWLKPSKISIRVGYLDEFAHGGGVSCCQPGFSIMTKPILTYHWLDERGGLLHVSNGVMSPTV